MPGAFERCQVTGQVTRQTDECAKRGREREREREQNERTEMIKMSAKRLSKWMSNGEKASGEELQSPHVELGELWKENSAKGTMQMKLWKGTG